MNYLRVLGRPLFPILAVVLTLSSCGSGSVPTSSPTPASTVSSAKPTPYSTSVNPTDHKDAETVTPRGAIPEAKHPSSTATVVPTRTSAPPAVDQPKYGGSVTVPVGNGWGLDPAGNVFGFSWDKLGAGGNVWNQLIRTSPSDRKTLEGDLAESWVLSGDGQSLTVKIRQGIVDHGGTPYTADDAYYQLYRYLTRPNKTPANTQSCLRGYLNPVLDASGNRTANPGVELISSDELTIRFNAPRGANIACLSSPSVLFVPSKYIKAIDKDPAGYRDLDATKGEYIGTGPFKLDPATFRVDSTMTWVKNSTYFRKGLPYLDSVNLVFMADSSAIIANIRAGRLDTLTPLTSSFSLREVKQLADESRGALVLKYMDQYQWDGFQLNVRRPPFGPVTDPTAAKIRMAIQLGFNRSEHISVMYDGLARPAFGYNAQDTWINTQAGWYSAMPAYDPDPKVRAGLIQQANQLMADAGYGLNNRLNVTFICGTSGMLRCEQIAGQLNNDLPIDMKVETIDAQTNTRRITTGDFQIMTTNHNGRFNDPDAMNLNMYPIYEKGGRNYTGYENQEWLRLNALQVAEPDQAKRGAILRDMAKALYKDAGIINGANPKNMWLMRNNWRGFTTMEDPNTDYTLETVWLAK